MARFKLKRRLEQGWTGHLATISAIKNSYQDLLDLLEFVGSYCKSSGEDVAEAIGYSLKIKSLWFVITLATIEVVLLIFKPINAILQTKTMDVATALPLLDHVIQQIHAKRDDETFCNILFVWSSDSVAEFPECAPKCAKRVDEKTLISQIM